MLLGRATFEVEESLIARNSQGKGRMGIDKGKSFRD